MNGFAGMKKRIKILAIVGLVLVVVLVIAANVWRGNGQVKGVVVDVDNNGSPELVTAQELAALVQASMPDILAKPLADVDMSLVEGAVMKSPYLCSAEAATSISGNVVVRVVQRHVIARVFANDKEYYLDRKGTLVPARKGDIADLIVASGNIGVKGTGLKRVWLLSNYLDTHPQYSVFFDQIYLDEQCDLYLVPKLGGHVVQVGDANDLDAKFHDLMAFYTRGLSRTGWDKYAQVSVKYKGQVVCKKRQK